MARPPDRPKTPAAKPAPADDDAALFDAAMRDVERLKGRPPDAPAKDQPSPPGSAAGRATQRTPAAPARPGAPLPPLAAGASADVDARTMDRLRRGRLRPEARLDLHGLTQEKAHRALDRFMTEAQASGHRCVIVITGKGRVSEGGGVLRNQVPGWLNAPGLRPRILAFAPAQPRDGGAGALYVLLRRVR